MHTVEAGIRGSLVAVGAGRLSYNVRLFRTVLDDDIGFVNSDTLGRAFFTNIEANLTKPLPAFFTLNLNTSYQVTPHVQLFGFVQNVTNAKYHTFGTTFAPTSAVVIAQAPGATNPRAYSPAAPIGGFAGVKVTF